MILQFAQDTVLFLNTIQYQNCANTNVLVLDWFVKIAVRLRPTSRRICRIWSWKRSRRTVLASHITWCYSRILKQSCTSTCLIEAGIQILPWTSLNCAYAARQSVRVRQSHQTFNSTILIISIATAFSVLPKFPVEGEGHQLQDFWSPEVGRWCS